MTSPSFATFFDEVVLPAWERHTVSRGASLEAAAVGETLAAIAVFLTEATTRRPDSAVPESAYGEALERDIAALFEPPGRDALTPKARGVACSVCRPRPTCPLAATGSAATVAQAATLLCHLRGELEEGATAAVAARIIDRFDADTTRASTEASKGLASAAIVHFLLAPERDSTWERHICLIAAELRARFPQDDDEVSGSVSTPVVGDKRPRDADDSSMPPAPFDPEHPQRVSGSTSLKIVQRMRRAAAAASVSTSPMALFYADTKYDGERLLVHKYATAGRTFAFHSRNMLRVPDRKLSGVAELLRASIVADSFVIDAEILSPYTHGTLNAVSKADVATKGPHIYCFDLLFVNGRCLRSTPMHQRRMELQRILSKRMVVTATTPPTAVHGVVEMAEHVAFGAGGEREASDEVIAARLLRHVQTTLKRGLEGIVVKPAAAHYRFGGTAWVKVKAGYLLDEDDHGGPRGVVPPTGGAGAATRPLLGAAVTASRAASPPPLTTGGPRVTVPLRDTLDVIVVAEAEGCPEELHRVGPPSPTCRWYLCAVFHAAKGTFCTVGFAACDPTEGALAQAHLDSLFRDEARSQPHHQSTALHYCAVRPSLRLRRSVRSLVECVVVEVRAPCLTEAPQHTCDQVAVTCGPTAAVGGVTRWPRILRVREDKLWRHCSTTAEIAALFAEGLSRPCDGPGVPRGWGDVDRSACPATTTRSNEPEPPSSVVSRTLASCNAPTHDEGSWRGPVSVTEAGPDECGARSVASLMSGACLTASSVVCLAVLCAPGKPFSSRGSMGEATRQFGNELQVACDRCFLGSSPAAVAGSICAVILPAGGPPSRARFLAVATGVAAADLRATVHRGGTAMAIDRDAVRTAVVKLHALMNRLSTQRSSNSSVAPAWELHLDVWLRDLTSELERRQTLADIAAEWRAGGKGTAAAAAAHTAASPSAISYPVGKVILYPRW